MCEQRESNVLKIEANVSTTGNKLVNQAVVEKQFLYSDIVIIASPHIHRYITLINRLKITVRILLS